MTIRIRHYRCGGRESVGGWRERTAKSPARVRLEQVEDSEACRYQGEIRKADSGNQMTVRW